MRHLKLILFSLLLANTVKAQDNFENEINDTIKKLAPLIIVIKQQSPERMPETKDNVLFSGKKNEVLKLSNINGNLTNNNAREIFARVKMFFEIHLLDKDPKFLGEPIQIN